MNIRSGPGTEYEVVGDATAGEEFAITGKNSESNWWQIDFRGESGWIYAPYVIAADAEDVPIVGTAMTETPVPEEATTESSPTTQIAIVTVGGDMNVRSGPGEEYDRIGGATAGEEFEITGKDTDEEWWQIDFDDQTGWIYAPYVTASNADNVPIVGDSSTETPISTPESSGAGPTPEYPAVTVGGDLNVRDGPGTEYDRIGGATAGEEFTITGKSADGEWWQIDFGGQSGWLYTPYVTATNADNVPVVSPDPPSEPTPEVQGATSANSGRRTVIANSSDGDSLGVQFKEE